MAVQRKQSLSVLELILPVAQKALWWCTCMVNSSICFIFCHLKKRKKCEHVPPGYYEHSVQFSSVAQLCPPLCNPMNCSTRGLPVHQSITNCQSLHKLMSIEFEWCHPTISLSVIPFSFCPRSFPASGSFPVTQRFASDDQSIGVSASTSVLPVNTQDWSLGWTSWIFLQSKGLSRVFSSTTVQKHQFFGAQLYL